ncbi:MAG: response regulator [Deltaproteobacteria bacterium]|nr:response regulator [Deltaproteobacteria bacterium]
MKVLILEDADFDAVLIEYELEKLKVPLSLRRVVTREEFLKALEEFRPGLILADYRLPAFDGLTALALAQEKCPEAPFIFVSGAMSPELAEAGLKQGAADWVPKNQLSQLAAAVARTLGGVDPGAPVPEPPKPAENLWPNLFHRTKKVVVILDLECTILEFNRGAELLSGWQRHEVLGLDFVQLLVDREKRDWAQAKLGLVAARGNQRGFELPIRSRSGGIYYWYCQPTLLENLEGQAETILLLADDLAGQGSGKSNGRAIKTFSVKGRPNLIC